MPPWGRSLVTLAGVVLGSCGGRGETPAVHDVSRGQERESAVGTEASNPGDPSGQVEPTCDVAGEAVPFAALRLDSTGCPELATTPYGAEYEVLAQRASIGIDTVASAAEFRSAFHCEAPRGVDFGQRVAVYRYRRSTSQDVELARVVDQGSRLVMVYEYRTACQGIAPTLHRGVSAAYVPAGPERVDVAECLVPTTCPEGIP